jgi:hypothetical protein
LSQAQSYANHVRIVPGFHYGVLGIFALINVRIHAPKSVRPAAENRTTIGRRPLTSME